MFCRFSCAVDGGTQAHTMGMPTITDYGAATEYKHSYGSKHAKLPPPPPPRMVTDATSSHIGLPNPGLCPAAAVPTWASPLYAHKPPPGHYTPASTLITGTTPPPCFANTFMYKSVPSASLR